MSTNIDNDHKSGNRFIRNKIEMSYVTIDEEGKKVTMYLVQCRICSEQFKHKNVIDARGKFIRHFVFRHGEYL